MAVWAMAGDAHARACRFAIVPLLVGYLVCVDRLPVPFWPLFVPLVWLVHAIGVCVLVRGDESFKVLVWAGAVFFHTVIIEALPWEMPHFDLLALVAMVWAAALLVLPVAVPRSARMSGWCRTRAGCFLTVAVLWAILSWKCRSAFQYQNHMATWIAMAFAAIVVVWMERRRMARTVDAWHYLGTLALSLALPVLTVAFSTRRQTEYTERILVETFLIILSLLVLSWSVWAIRWQRRAVENYHPDLLELASVGVVLWCLFLGIFLLYKGLWIAVLAFSLVLHRIAARELRTLRAIPAPAPLPRAAHWGDGETDGAGTPPVEMRNEERGMQDDIEA